MIESGQQAVTVGSWLQQCYSCVFMLFLVHLHLLGDQAVEYQWRGWVTNINSRTEIDIDSWHLAFVSFCLHLFKARSGSMTGSISRLIIKVLIFVKTSTSVRGLRLIQLRPSLCRVKLLNTNRRTMPVFVTHFSMSSLVWMLKKCVQSAMISPVVLSYL